MIAVDTNVVVRLLTNDDARQSKRAADLFRRQPVMLSKTVLLESEWVLRHGYGVERSAIGRAFRRLLGLPGVSIEGSEEIALALDWFDDGLDFADALHLATAQKANADGFTTFDRSLVKRAARFADIKLALP